MTFPDIAALKALATEWRAKHEPWNAATSSYAWKHCADQLEAALSRLLEAQAGVPEGWQLVPKESTREMCQAIMDAIGQGWTNTRVWEVALLAAPHPPSEGEQT